MPANIEEIQQLRTTRCMRRARKCVPACERIDKAGFSDIGAAGKGDLDIADRR
ncbi:MAG: hypothetical protein RL543_557 [Pseudomonadota bacterium]